MAETPVVENDSEDYLEMVEHMFDDRMDVMSRYAELLCTTGVDHGLIGPREVPRIWSRHIVNCAVVGDLIDPEQSVIDVGSGAGLPGLALACWRTDLRVSLVEPLERRVKWLHRAIEALEVDVQVHHGRAEEFHGELNAEVVTSRAVANLTKLSSWCMPLVSPGGRMLAIKGQSAKDELTKATKHLRKLGARDGCVSLCGEDLPGIPTRVVQVFK